ncbi:hypothetical protein GUJ93_ZPchr0009g2056 [Zizania palustris]|uniref:Uncharacterized protein n=1 Tax=Zizania palustris TaxID=103762 RepID=A0A8J5RLT5_ZIZPA|nr:hypothetical protein GUJ93_ZPchr0009g2056 [Zizania palustris]
MVATYFGRSTKSNNIEFLGNHFSIFPIFSFSFLFFSFSLFSFLIFLFSISISSFSFLATHSSHPIRTNLPFFFLLHSSSLSLLHFFSPSGSFLAPPSSPATRPDKAG